MSTLSFPKTAVIGAEGYIGRNLLASIRKVYPDAIGTSRRKDSSLFFLDVSNPFLDVTELVRTGHTHAVITVAMPNIMFCETFPKAAAVVNVDGVLRIVSLLSDSGIVPVFYSSDRVFDGAGKGPFAETDTPKAASIYGQQKRLVEEVLLKDHPKALILRLSKVYGLEKGDGTLFDDMATRLLGDRAIDPPFDQVFSPTWIEDVIQGTLSLIGAGENGIFHVCAEPAVKRRDLGLAMAKTLGANPALVPVPPEDVQFSPMSAAKFRDVTGISPVSPQQGLERIASLYKEAAASKFQSSCIDAGENMSESSIDPKELWEKVRAFDKTTESIVLGPNSSWKLLTDPRHLLFTFARYKHAARLLPQKKDKTILELGCGEGLGALFLAENASKVVCVDFDEDSITHARKHFPKDNVEYRNADFLNTRLGKFDGIVSLDVIEHVETRIEDKFIESCVNNLTDDGVCVIGTPNDTASPYASEGSKIGHINMYTAERLHELLYKYFHNVFIFGMNDEVLHTGFFPMCHYILCAACNPRK